MKRSKQLTVSIEPEVFSLMMRKLDNISLYAYTAIIQKLTQDGLLTEEALVAMYVEDDDDVDTIQVSQ